MNRPTTRPRILYVDHVALLSGGEIALERLIAALGDTVEAHVVLGEDGPLVPRLEAVGATVHLLPIPAAMGGTRKDAVRPGALGLRAVLESLGHVWQVRGLIRQLRPDLVHTNSLKAALYGGLAGRLAGVPVLWHVRDRIATDYLPAPAVHLVRLTARVVPNWIVANSAATLATVGGPRRKHTGVVDDPLPADPIRSDRLPDNRVGAPLTVGVVGRLAEWKGQHVFLEAFARALPDGPERAVLVGSAMFGEDEYAAGLETQAARLGLGERVDFRGFREDVVAELSRIDVLVHCSVVPEPFGQVVIEGMAAGLPVIAADAGGPAEVVTDGVDGLLVPPGDADGLARALRRLAEDPAERRRLGAAALVSSRRFAPEVVAQQMLEVYRAILSRSS